MIPMQAIGTRPKTVHSMVSHNERSSFFTLQCAKATLRNPKANWAEKQEMRNYLISEHKWNTKRLIAYEKEPYMILYEVHIKRERTQASRIITIPALCSKDARLGAAVMYPDWIILRASPASQ